MFIDPSVYQRSAPLHHGTHEFLARPGRRACTARGIGLPTLAARLRRLPRVVYDAYARYWINKDRGCRSSEWREGTRARHHISVTGAGPSNPAHWRKATLSHV